MKEKGKGKKNRRGLFIASKVRMVTLNLSLIRREGDKDPKGDIFTYHSELRLNPSKYQIPSGRIWKT